MHRMITMHARSRRTDEHYGNSATIRSNERMHRSLIKHSKDFAAERPLPLSGTCMSNRLNPLQNMFVQMYDITTHTITIRRCIVPKREGTSKVILGGGTA